MSDGQPMIHVIDDDSSFRTALARLLRAAKYEVRSYASAADFLRGDPGAGLSCIILDLDMPEASGLDLQKVVATMDDPLPIVFLSGKGNIPASVRAMKDGAVDFLTKPVQRQTLLRAIEVALERNAAETEARAILRELQTRYATLTRREREVVAHVISGKLNKQIAYDLGTTDRTIKAHRASIMDKLGIDSVAELTRMANRLGIQPIH
jgi:FixJ family two-component response regulator